MRGNVEMTLPEIALVLGTRVALGVGLGLLIANFIPSTERRTAIGWTLFLSGAYSGACLAAELFGRPRKLALSFGADHADHRVGLPT